MCFSRVISANKYNSPIAKFQLACIRLYSSNIFVQTIINEQIQRGGNDYVIIEKNIDLYDEDGNFLISLGPNQTKPDEGSTLSVSDWNDTQYCVKLKSNHMKQSHLDKSIDEEGLLVYRKFEKGPKYNYHPHKYPASAMRNRNPFLEPFLIPEKRFQRQVGMSCHQFWELVDRLIIAGLKKRDNLTEEAMVALYRTKLREDLDFSLLATMYGSINEQVCI